MKNIIFVILILVLGIIVVRQQREISLLKHMAEESTDARPNPPTALPAPAPVIPVEPSMPMPAMKIPAVSQNSQPAPVATSPQKPSNMFSAMGSMMTNPAMREMLRTQSETQLAMQYSSLYAYLDLPPDNLQALRELLMNRQMALMDAGLALMGGDAPPEKRKQNAKELEDTKTAFDKEIEKLLGAQDYDVFKQYEDTQAERTQVETFKRSIADSADALTDQQVSDLVFAMHSARTNLHVSHSRTDDSPRPSELTEGRMTEALKHMDQLQSQYVETASKILTPAQFTQFQNFMAQQRALQEMGVKMAAKMFGQGAPAAESAAGRPIAP